MKFTNYHIEEICDTENLSERTKNVCLKGSLDTLHKILIYYFKNESFKKIRNCGEKTNKELIALSKKYIKEYQIEPEDLEFSDSFLVFEKFKIFCFENFGIPSTETEKFREAFFKKDYTLFSYLIELFKYVLNEREYFIFKHNFGYFDSKDKMTLQSIGDMYDITRERIRQISQMIPYKLEEAMELLATEQSFILDLLKYKLKKREDHILIDDETAVQINKKEDVNLTSKFYALIFGILYSRRYGMFQNKEKSYNEYFIIRNDLLRKFDFEGFFNEITERLEKRIEEDYNVSFNELTEKHLKNKDKDILNRSRTICKKIVQDEFMLELTYEGMIVFKRNTLIKLSEYITEILDEFQTPMTLKDIHKELVKRTNKAPQNIESLRSSILSIDNIVAIGKTSTYAMDHWDNVKTGTIKELVKEYLSNYDEPKHISEIADHITKFRDTNDKNILSNLKLDRSGTFVFFKKSYIGLRDKKYIKLSAKYGQLKLL